MHNADLPFNLLYFFFFFPGVIPIRLQVLVLHGAGF